VKKGKFIALEGIDGAGTTTLAEMLLKWLESRGIQAVVTREPSDGPIGGLIRNALRGRIRQPETAGGDSLSMETIALLFAADRVDHLESEILPALEQGVWVISDRYVHSSQAYQGTLIDIEWVANINRYAVMPDLTLFLEVEVDTALKRIGTTRVQTDIFETKELLDRIAGGYRKLYSEPSDDVVILDSNQSLDEVRTQLVAALTAAFPHV